MPDPSILSARWALRWDDEGLHGRVEVTDAVLRNADGRPYHNDGVEINLDGDNTKALDYEADDLQIRGVRQGVVTADRGALPSGFSASRREVPGGWAIDFRLPLGPGAGAGRFVGIDLHVVDNDGDRREHKIAWAASHDGAYRSPAAFGTVRLGE
jgi:hypothetical protein